MAAHFVTRRTILRTSLFAAAGAAFAGCASTSSIVEAPVTTPAEALARLLEGNARYAANRTIDLNEGAARRIEVAAGQHPFATIIGCVDSRVPPELVFDRGLGDLFVIRTAGHAIDSAVLGSLQYGVAELNVPLLVVLGHEKCGAVKATIEAVEKHAEAEADIGAIVAAIRPAIERVEHDAGDMLDNATVAHVLMTVSRLQASPILSDAVAKGTLKIAGAIYRLESGKVDLLG